MYIKVTDTGVLFPYGVDVLRRENPNVSFPQTFTDEQLVNYNIYPVTQVNPPEFDQSTQTVNRIDPVLIDDKWFEAWEVVDLPAEELEARVQEKQAEVRARRDRLLSETDWYVVKALEDKTEVPANVREYRNALRDITIQPGFPLNVIWPVL